VLGIARRRTVTKWIQAAGLSEQFQRVFYHLLKIGRQPLQLFKNMLEQMIDDHRTLLHKSACLRIVLDNSPTKRYGSKVEGAKSHHHLTPGRTDSKICYGYSWVVAVLVITYWF
jgi:hypothetical protein